ncbi:MAG TPA: hypothetical protein VF789_28910 [Thermoanaerobaculia bacterium]
MCEKTLSFNPLTGQFTLDSVNQPSTGAFRIRLDTPGTIVINAGPGIQFVPLTSDSKPVETLSLNNSGFVEALSLSATQITLDVTQLPSTSGVLGFILFVQLTTGIPTIHGIETPPFFITRNEHFTAPHLFLHYLPPTGDFHIADNNGHESPLLLPVEKGVVILRLSEGGSNDNEVQTIQVTLHDDTATAGVKFATTHAAVSTLPPGPLAPSIERISDTEVHITKPFTPGTGFGVSFAVEVPQEGHETCTIFSPDPVIIDKTVGSNPPGSA